VTAIRLVGTAGDVSLIDDDELLTLAAPDGMVAISAILGAIDRLGPATHCTAISENGAYRACIPLENVHTGGRLAVRRDGKPIPPTDGGPYRLTVEQGATLCWNVKAVEEFRLSDGPLPDDVPADPTH